MAVNVDITGITGDSPFDVYICQTDGTGCFYMTTINTTTYNFDIPEPYDTAQDYLLKLVDSKGCIISGTSQVL